MSVTKTIEIPGSPDTVGEVSPPYAGEHIHTHPCPICEAKNYMPNAETIAAIEESRAMMRGEIPSTLRSFDTLEEMWEDLMRDEPDDDLDD